MAPVRNNDSDKKNEGRGNAKLKKQRLGEYERKQMLCPDNERRQQPGYKNPLNNPDDCFFVSYEKIH